MQIIELEKVTRDVGAKKRPKQGRGGGGQVDFWGRNSEKRTGTKDQEPVFRSGPVWWSWFIVLILRRGRVIICKPPAVGWNPFAGLVEIPFLKWNWRVEVHGLPGLKIETWGPRRDLGHPDLIVILGSPARFRMIRHITPTELFSTSSIFP
jgi:hypothetical protein